MKKNKFYTQVSEDTYNIDVALLHKYATEYDCNEDTEGLADEIQEALDVAEDCGRYWSDEDPLFPNNNYNYGFVLDDYLFIRYYTGVADKYWNKEGGPWTYCHPLW
jgi:hypothetical protein